MDCWRHLDVTRYIDFQEFPGNASRAESGYGSKKHQTLHQCKIRTRQLHHIPAKRKRQESEEILVKQRRNLHPVSLYFESIPRLHQFIAIMLYEALRQQEFCIMQRRRLHRLHWKDQDEQKSA